VGIRDDLARDPPSRRPDDRLVRIRHDDRVLAAKTDARPPIPGEFHASILTQPPAPRITAARRRHTAFVSATQSRRPALSRRLRQPRSPTQNERGRLPNRRPLSEGGRMEPRGFGPNRTLDRPSSSTATEAIKKATRWRPVPPVDLRQRRPVRQSRGCSAAGSRRRFVREPPRGPPPGLGWTASGRPRSRWASL
jgi:hypothetical protein